PTWLRWLNVLIWLIFFISFFLIFIYSFVTFANLIAAPFNSLLSQKVEMHLTGIVPESRSLWENIKDIPHIVGRQLAIIGYYLPRALLILILFIIPIIHFIAAILWFLFNAKFMALQYIDYPTDSHRLPLREVRIWFKQNRMLIMGFGISVLVA